MNDKLMSEASSCSLFLRNRANAIGKLNEYDKILLLDSSRVIDELSDIVKMLPDDCLRSSDDPAVSAAGAGCGQFTGGPGDDSIKIIKPAADGTDSLDPCPFCDETEIVYELYDRGVGERWRCWCTSCLASIDPGWAQDRHVVRDMWNHRPEEVNTPLTVEELLDMGGEPVWMEFCECVGCWCIVQTDMEPILGLRVLRNNGIHTDIRSTIKDGRKFYRHKPKEGKH